MTIPGFEHGSAEWQIRAVLLQAIQSFEPTVAHEARTLNPAQLLQLAQTYSPLPKEVLGLITSNIEKLNQGQDVPSLGAGDCAILDKWLSTGLSCAPSDPVLPGSPEPVAPATPRLSLPSDWKKLVNKIRFGLSTTPPEHPFEKWCMPNSQWASLWSEAYTVIPRDEERDQKGLLIVPSEDSSAHKEAQKWWHLRVQAANALRSRAGKGLRWPRVIEHASPESPGFVLFDLPEFAGRSLLDRFERGVPVGGRLLVELAIELCVTIRSLNDFGVHVLNLAPEHIMFEWSDGARFTLLTDPTAVIPCAALIPEWRSFEWPEPEILDAQRVEPSQVFLIGALLLSSLRNAPKLMAHKLFPEGRCASLAVLAGQPQLANGTVESILEPLTNELELQSRMGETNARKLVSCIRWCLSEQPEDRYPRLDDLGRELKAAIS